MSVNPEADLETLTLVYLMRLESRKACRCLFLNKCMRGLYTLFSEIHKCDKFGYIFFPRVGYLPGQLHIDHKAKIVITLDCKWYLKRNQKLLVVLLLNSRIRFIQFQGM